MGLDSKVYYRCLADKIILLSTLLRQRIAWDGGPTNALNTMLCFAKGEAQFKIFILERVL
jgi:hypothetical protein